MPNEPIWLTFEIVSQLHQHSLAKFGGAEGLLDEGAVRSAIRAPENMLAYESVDDPIALAVRYCVRLCANHGFRDGNKRVATAAMLYFLAINGIRVACNDTPDEHGTTELSRAIVALASHELDEEALRDFIESRAYYAGEETGEASSSSDADAE